MRYEIDIYGVLLPALLLWLLVVAEEVKHGSSVVGATNYEIGIIHHAASRNLAISAAALVALR